MTKTVLALLALAFLLAADTAIAQTPSATTGLDHLAFLLNH